MADLAPTVLDAATAAFICSGISINAASARAGALPSMARATGCRVSSDRQTITLLFASTPAAALLDDLRHSGTIAVVFSEPSTHRTLQLKGDDTRIEPPGAGDEKLAADYVTVFADGLVRLGYPGEVLRAVLAYAPGDLVAVRFTPQTAFSQTPGPGAGAPLSRT